MGHWWAIGALLHQRPKIDQPFSVPFLLLLLFHPQGLTLPAAPPSSPPKLPPPTQTAFVTFLRFFSSLIKLIITTYTLVSLCRRQPGILSFFFAIRLLGILAGKGSAHPLLARHPSDRLLRRLLNTVLRRKKERWSCTEQYHVTMR